MKIDPPLSKL